MIDAFELLKQKVDGFVATKIFGKVRSVRGTIIEVSGIAQFVSIGSKCIIRKNNSKSYDVTCEVVGLNGDTAILMPFGDLDGIGVNLKVEVCQLDDHHVIKPNDCWKGRVIDAFCNPIDGGPPLLLGHAEYSIKHKSDSKQIRKNFGPKLSLGVKCLDLFASCCIGQRMGIFAGSGVGKSILVSMITKYAKTPVKVIGLVGERSREVNEFIHQYLGQAGLKDAVIVVATGDESPLVRKRAAYVTMAIAEYFRDQGQEVLCVIDSITRFAMAQREIGLAVGEPPTTKGYTPSVFSELPRLLERAGPGSQESSITGLFAVLVDGDDHNEPISDAVRGILDGHIVLSRSIGEGGRYPAVDILRSVSRALPRCNTEEENAIISNCKRLLSLYQDMAELVRIGAYKKGSDPDVDKSIGLHKEIEQFLKQDPGTSSYIEESYVGLKKICSKFF